MEPNDIKKRLRNEPFRALRVYASDGSSYELLDSHHGYLEQTRLVIGLDPDPNDIPTRSVDIDTRHVTRLEFVTKPAPPPGKGDGNGRP